MHRNLIWFLLMVFFLIFFGCSYRIGDLTAMSTRNVTLENLKLNYEKAVNQVEGKDCKPTIFFIKTGTPDLEEAIDNAMDKANGNLMTDVALYYSIWNFLIFGNECFSCKGTVYNTRE